MSTDLEMFLLALYQQTNDPIIWVDEHGRIIFLNSKAEVFFGYEKNELIGQDIEILIPDKFKKNYRLFKEKYQKKPISKQIDRGKKLQAQHKNKTILEIDLSLYPITIPTGQKAIAILIRDVQDYRDYEKELINIHNHDSLTGLMTGAYLHHKLQEIISSDGSLNQLFALCMIDIDHFKQINDIYGHDS